MGERTVKRSKGLLAGFVGLGLAAMGAAADVMPTNTLRVWLAADAIAGLSDGDAVTNWPDRSGNGLDATNLPGHAPSYRTAVANGYPVVRFDPAGQTNYLQRADYVPGTNDLTLIVVTRRNGASVGYQNVFIGGASSFTVAGTAFYQLYAPAGAGGTLVGNFYVNALDVDSGVAFAADHFAVVVLSKASAGGGTSQIHIDGVPRASSSGAQTLGAGYLLGAWSGNRMNGDVAEVLLYGSPLGTNDRQLAEGALAWKYGLYPYLPSDHPWKSIDPNSPTSAVPGIENGAPADVTPQAATLAGRLINTGSAPATVAVYWGPADGGVPAAGRWAFTNVFAEGQWGTGSFPSTNVALPSSNLVYYYRFYATNSAGHSWAGSATSFYGGAVWVETPDASASETGDPGLFVVRRAAEGTAATVRVNVGFTGTATNTEYYLSPPASGSVLLSAGVAQTSIVVRAAADRYAEPAESVVLELLSGAYAVGSPGSGTVTIAASTTNGTSTLAYWRFEGGFDPANRAAGFFADSSGSGHDIDPSGGVYTSSNQVAVPRLDGGSYRGAAFPSPIPRTGAVNGKALFTSAGSAWLLVPDSPDWTQPAFTVEALISASAMGTSGYDCVVSQWGSGSSQRSWFFGRNLNSWRLALILSANGTTSSILAGPGPDWDLFASNDYYVAFSFDRARATNGVTLYLKNLTANGPLRRAALAHSLTGGLFEAAFPLNINAFNSVGSGVSGMIDELRISRGVLPEDELLIQPRRAGVRVMLK